MLISEGIAEIILNYSLVVKGGVFKMNKKVKNILEFILVCQIPLIAFDFFSGARKIDGVYAIIIFITAVLYFFLRDAIKNKN